MNKYWYFISILLMFSYGQLHAEQPVPIASASDWVIEKKYNLNPQIPHNEIKKGVYYLLVDNQIRINSSGKKESFLHYAEHIVNQNGIEESAQINISFDPAYQKLTLNSLLIWRNGKRIDKTSTAKMSLLQREEDLENLIYNGKHTLNIILDDVRVGDIIEYSYSRVGANPVFQDIFAYNRYLQWSVPVDLLHFRLLWEKPVPLHYKIYNSKLKLNKKNTANGYEYWIEKIILPPWRQVMMHPHGLIPISIYNLVNLKNGMMLPNGNYLYMKMLFKVLKILNQLQMK